ncbi:MAG: hypothetical protein HY928_05975 [Elusimicrobia bacterium]|nr:hypothetical protein [Elusimicrobiota bacterium]
MFSLDGDPQYQAIASSLAALQKAALRFPEVQSKAFLAALDGAFPNKEPLPAGELLKERYAGKSAKALELFGGKPPMDLPPQLLREHWSQTVYFSDKAWSRYLPAFLKAAVTGGRRDFLHSVLFMLQPRWAALYEGEDAHPQDKALGEEGNKAVAAFLELAFDAPGNLTWETDKSLPYGMAERELHGAEFQYRWMAAQALAWRFNAVETDALKKAQAEYKALCEGGIPDPKLPSAKAVAVLIRQAFAKTPAPGPHDLTDSRQGDEPFEYAVEFRGKDWKSLGVGFLSHHSSALSFFSPAALRYFIPAFMLADLTGADWNGDPVFALTHGLSKEDEEKDDTFDWAAIARRKFDPFSPEERQAVAAYLEHAGRQYASGDPRISEALASYWSLPLRPPSP